MDFEDIVRKPQNELKKALIAELVRMGYETRTRQGFTYAEGKLPVMLAAHLDTVHKEPVKVICYSKDGSIVMSPEGIGGDDRTGVYMILQTIKKHQCHVLFCEDEEIGGMGAKDFVKSGIKPDINYIIELDRRGSDDAVFYRCNNPVFTKFLCGFGFSEEMGSFSDISVIAPELGIAAVNISAGYYHEHRVHEYVDMNVVKKNIERVGKMVSVPSEKYEYIETVYRHGFNSDFYEDFYDFDNYFKGINGVNEKMLMPLPETVYIKKSDSEPEERNGQYFIDKSGKLYEYLYDIDLVVELGEGDVITKDNLPFKFKSKNAVRINVVHKR